MVSRPTATPIGWWVGTAVAVAGRHSESGTDRYSHQKDVSCRTEALRRVLTYICSGANEERKGKNAGMVPRWFRNWAARYIRSKQCQSSFRNKLSVLIDFKSNVAIPALIGVRVARHGVILSTNSRQH
jgi:hypothetical protein